MSDCCTVKLEWKKVESRPYVEYAVTAGGVYVLCLRVGDGAHPYTQVFYVPGSVKPPRALNPGLWGLPHKVLFNQRGASKHLDAQGKRIAEGHHAKRQ